jgi:hypothetical protein
MLAYECLHQALRGTETQIQYQELKDIHIPNPKVAKGTVF